MTEAPGSTRPTMVPYFGYGPEDADFGTRRYRALDPEGYEWSFGTYSPSP